MRRMPRPPLSMQAARDWILGAHPSASVRSLDSVYNCVGMVFASRRTWVEPTHIPMILEEDGYRLIDRSELECGDVVVYRRDDLSEVSHVGMVAKVTVKPKDASLEVLVLSQWGQDGEYIHLDDDVNPMLGTPTEYWTDRI